MSPLPSPPTILLTGLPRSGTTLACALLNECPDTVALAEPLSLTRHGDRDRAVAEIETFIGHTRAQILRDGTAFSTHIGGQIPDNWAEEPDPAGGLRRSRAEHGLIRITARLSPQFRLILKQPGEFSALADLLAPRYPLLALIRHPLAVLASWQTVAFPVHHGHMPVAELFNPELAATLARVPDRLERQVALIGWLLALYRQLPPDQVLRYEDLIATPETVLARFGVTAASPLRPLRPESPALRYPCLDLRPLAAALWKISPLCEPFYPDFTASLEKTLQAG